MTESSHPIPSPSHVHSPLPALIPESFWSILVRRSRYLIAIAVSAIIFSFVAWSFIAPPPSMAGVSLLAWSMSTGLIGAVVLTLILIIVGTICTILVHPDAPHMGLFCALAGMAVLSIRGGTSHMLIQYGQETNTWSNLSILLAIECVQWAILILVVETVVRLAHDQFFANTHWLSRSGPGVTEQAIGKFAATRGALGISLTVSQFMGTVKAPRWIAAPLALVASGLIAFLLLYVLLQSDLKGQVFFACYLAFFVSTLLSYVAFPRVPAVVFFLAVPLTAAVGYYLGSNHPTFIYPGQGGYFLSRALPIDFIAAGIPGAILGYYAAIRWSLNSHEPQA